MGLRSSSFNQHLLASLNHKLIDVPQVFICEPLTLLDVERSKRQTQWLGRSTYICTELKGISLFQLLPGDKLCKPHPAVVRVKCAAERHVEVLD